MSLAATPAHLSSPVHIDTRSPRDGLLGLLPELDRDALGLLIRLAREYGDLVRLRLGLTRTVLLSHPDLVEEVLVTRNHDFRKNLGGSAPGQVIDPMAVVTLRPRQSVQVTLVDRR